MGRIRILSDNVANKIAAGEVVERPASVVKELLENSLDAGATDFRLDIEAGGRKLIRLADDGSGMMHDDALLAFERHATSKLSDVKDLLSISTLGFRGEALPSIASVSRLLLETKAREERAGTVVEIAGGKMFRVEEIAHPGGTTITVRDLFYNVPARKNFLRSEQTEIAHIASLVTHYSLAHPSKSFTLRHNNTELLAVTPVATLRERVFQVFGTQVLEDLFDLGDHARDLKVPVSHPGDDEPFSRRFRLRGFVSSPGVQKMNRNSIYLFVNGRLIRDRLLLHAISAAVDGGASGLPHSRTQSAAARRGAALFRVQPARREHDVRFVDAGVSSSTDICRIRAYRSGRFAGVRAAAAAVAPAALRFLRCAGDAFLHP